MKQKQIQKKNHENNRIITVLVVLTILFVALIVYLTYFEIFQADTISNNSYNKRLLLNEEYILRGNIYDRNHTLLASSSQEGDRQTRHYEYGSLYSHIIGYSNRQLGKFGLEKSYNEELLNKSKSESLNEIRKVLAQQDFQQRGNNLILTIDHGLQQYVSDLLGKQKGAIVAMNPQNGEVYAMVSYPNFDPNGISDNWNRISADQDSPLYNRATQGVYPPGSIFKIITTASALETQNINTNFNCEGQVVINGETLNDYNNTAHGEMDLHDALVKSCNVSFGQIALQLGENSLRETAEKFMFNRKISFDIETNPSTFPKGKLSENELAFTGIGQGKLQTSPLNMAMMASAIANNGKIVQPLLVKEVQSADGEIVETKETAELSTALSPTQISIIKDIMVDVVNEGTGSNARLSSVQVAGKTGTAEEDGEEDHAWFVGFAPSEEPKVAVAVFLENNGGTGGSTAAPIARKVISRALEAIE